LFKILLIVLGLVPLLGLPAQAAEPQTATLSVQNMTCSVCPVTVRKALEKVPGVIKASVDYDSKTASVTFDPGKATVEALTKATTDAGYPSSAAH
jgi:mercuric ion binding protein